MSPNQAIYSRIRQICTGITDTYDVLPPADVSYPFVYLGEQFKNDNREHKDHRNDLVNQTVHIYHDKLYQRGTFSSVMYDIENSVRAMTDAFGYRVQVEDVAVRTLEDTSTNKKLLHGVIEFEFKLI